LVACLHLPLGLSIANREPLHWAKSPKICPKPQKPSIAVLAATGPYLLNCGSSAVASARSEEVRPAVASKAEGVCSQAAVCRRFDLLRRFAAALDN